MLQNIAIWATLALSASAAAIEKRQSACPHYILINTRGTGEPQGESLGFKTMDNNTLAQVPGGSIYNTVYPADASPGSAAVGTKDIVREVNTVLESSPDMCFILQGYSQGATSTIGAMYEFTGTPAFDAVKGVFLIGDPEHLSGLECNVDNYGGTTTKYANGVFYKINPTIPENWVSKTLDVCIYGDGVCDTKTGYGVTFQHLEYPFNAPTQDLGLKFNIAHLT